ncbi:MAG TPA: hypothetical protein VI755_03260 [Anaerolineales bacterium]|nr:hypothetical protein [Anaerolineales bacterium]
MKLQTLHSQIIMISLAMLALAILPACSTWQDLGASASAEDIGDSAPPSSQPITASEPPPTPPDDSLTSSSPSTPQNMVAFEGTVFVASLQIVAERWKLAGWRIGDQPLNTENQEPPSDCTLYPHLGVENQWVGSCRGYILVPSDGARHIDVMLTAEDGSTTLVQVAPPPSN